MFDVWVPPRLCDLATSQVFYGDTLPELFRVVEIKASNWFLVRYKPCHAVAGEVESRSRGLLKALTKISERNYAHKKENALGGFPARPHAVHEVFYDVVGAITPPILWALAIFPHVDPASETLLRSARK